MIETPAPGTASELGLARRWFLFGLAAFAGGEIAFALISGTLDRYGDAADIAGHLLMLPVLGAVVLLAQRRALGLGPDWRPALACGIAAAAAYIAGFTLMGPPMDFLLSIVAIGFVSGVALALHFAGTPGRGWLVAAVFVPYLVGGAAGVGCAAAFGDRVDHLFGGGVTGFAGVVGMIGVVAGIIGSALSAPAVARILAGRRRAGRPGNAEASV